MSYQKRANFGTAHSFIFYMINFSYITEILLRIFAYTLHNNIIIYNVTSLVDVFFIMMFFYYYLDIKHKRDIILGLTTVFLIVFIYEIFSFGLFTVYSISFITLNIIIVLLSVIAFRGMVNKLSESLITNDPVFYILTGILLYHSSTLFVFGLVNLDIEYAIFNKVEVSIHVFLIILYNGLLALGLWKTSKKYTWS